MKQHTYFTQILDYLNKPTRKFSLKINQKINGSTKSLAVKIIKVKCKSTVSSNGIFELGKVVSDQVEIEIKSTEIVLSGITIELILYVDNNDSWNIRLGVYAIKEVKNNGDTMTIIAYDLISKFSKESLVGYQSDIFGIAYVVFNKNNMQLYAGSAGVSDAYKCTYKVQEGESYSDILEYAGQFMGVCYRKETNTSDERAYVPFFYKSESVEIMKEKCFEFSKVDGISELQAMECTTGESGSRLISGSGARGYFFNNPHMIQPALDFVFNKIKGFFYHTCRAKFMGNPLLEVGDIITITDGPKSYKVPIMSLEWEYDGGFTTTIESFPCDDSTSDYINSQSPSDVKFNNKVDKVSTSLKTNNKEVVGAINELYDSQVANVATFTNNVTLDTVALNGSRRVGKVVYVSLALSITAAVGNNVTLAALNGYTANGRAYLTVFSSNTFLISAYMENGSNAIKTMNVLPVGAGSSILITGTIVVN